MQCRYCRTWNEQDERRCVRCGRRLELASPRPAVDAYPIQTSTAPAFETIQGRAPQAQKPAVAVAVENKESQTSLFRETYRGAFGDASNVIPIPTLLPTHPEGGSGGTAVRRALSRPAAPKSPRPEVSQQRLEFQPPAVSVEQEVDNVIYCDAPVALPTHRLMAAAIDTSLVVVGMGVFLGIFFLSGNEIVLSRETVPVFVMVAIVLTGFYRALFCLGNGDTAGMRFAGLRLVDFDGRPPDRERRGLRQVASVLSLLSAGLGLVWALVDEESLTWHDHISKTFPTAIE